MQINKNLNLVVPVERDDGTAAYVYSLPVSTSVFERYYMVFARTFNVIYTGGLGMTSGPRVAAMILKDTAKALGVWDGPEGAERGLMQEIRRLTNVIVLTEKGWEPVPFHEAITKGSLDERDASEVENAIVFFTVSWHMNRWEDRKKGTEDKPTMLESAMKIWGGHLESLSFTEFCASLPTSTKAEISAPAQEMIPILQVPS
jgi:hypothetical protein